MKSLAKNWKMAFAVAPLLGLVVAAFTVAEDEPSEKTPSAKAAVRDDSGKTAWLDRYVAACLVLANQNEIAAARYAIKTSQNQEVIDFAQMMEKEHQQCLKDLHKFAGDQFADRNFETAHGPSKKSGARKDVPGVKPAADSKELPEGDQPKTARAVPKRDPKSVLAAVAAAVGTELHADALLQIKREIADECLTSCQRELEGKTGKSFDASYIGLQMAAHMQMINELKVLERHVSSEFKPALEKGRETAEKHLTHARQVMKNIEEGQGYDKKTTSTKE